MLRGVGEELDTALSATPQKEPDRAHDDACSKADPFTGQMDVVKGDATGGHQKDQIRSKPTLAEREQRLEAGPDNQNAS